MAASFLTDYDDNQSGYVGGCTSMNEIKLVDVPEMDYSSSDKDEKGNLAPRGEVCFRGKIYHINIIKKVQILLQGISVNLIGHKKRLTKMAGCTQVILVLSSQMEH
jgi:hypothetical protein